MTRRSPLILGAIAAAAALALAGCAAPIETNPVPGGTDEAPVASQAFNIGINQLVSHPSLDASAEGFQQAFIDAGYIDGETVNFDLQNAQADQATATTIATKFLGDNVDLVLAIATPAAQASVQAITNIPVLFTAVTEPLEAGLVASWEAPGDNVTGTSDMNPVAEQIALIKDLAPDATTVGIVYSSGEVNSAVQVELARAAAPALGLTLKEVTVSNASEVAQAVESLGDVDAIYVPGDNAVVEALESVIQVAETKKIPMVVAEGDSVERGGIATYGLNYYDLGYQTGQMAIRILEEGADPASMPVETLDKISLIVNQGAAERMGVELSAELLAKADTVLD